MKTLFLAMADRPASSMRKCASVPSLYLEKDPDFATEVYVTSRMLQEFSARVPKGLHTLMEDFGIAHYMVSHKVLMQCYSARQVQAVFVNT